VIVYSNIPQSLLVLFNSIEPLSHEIESEIASLLQHKVVQKKELLLRAGQICKHIYFIEKGLLRSYYFEDDNEVTTWFMKENDLIISVKSFFLQTESVENIEAIEEVSLHYISFDALMKLYNKHHSFCTIGRVLTQHYYIKSEERLLNIHKKEALAKYHYLLQQHPDIISRSPLKHIASYLGITIETLSRLRAKRI
jgi:CRP-like cAMP-binding protein